MKIEFKDKDFILNTKLGVVRDIEKEFGASFEKTISKIADMRLNERVKLLLVAIDKEDKKDVENLIYEEWGLSKLYEILGQFIEKIQYTGLSEEEIKEKEKEGLENLKKAKEIGLI